MFEMHCLEKLDLFNEQTKRINAKRRPEQKRN